MRIHMWAADTGGSALYRMDLVATGLTWQGHQVSVNNQLPPDWEECDVVVGARVSNPDAARMWKVMADKGIRLVLDMDDDYFHVDPTNAKAYELWNRPDHQKRLIESMEVSSTVTVCSQALAEVMAEYRDDVQVVENALPAQFLGMARDYSPEQLIVGWAGSESTIHELPLAIRHLNRIAEKDGVRTVLVGIHARDAVKTGARGKSVLATGWIDGHKEYMDQAWSFDLQAAPYRDTPFNRAKFPTKALEAGFFGVPLVASKIRPYAEWIEHGKNGFLVPTGQEHLFGRYLQQLVNDPQMRQEMGMAARARASRNILQGMAREWDKVMTG